MPNLVRVNGGMGGPVQGGMGGTIDNLLLAGGAFSLLLADTTSVLVLAS